MDKTTTTEMVDFYLLGEDPAEIAIMYGVTAGQVTEAFEGFRKAGLIERRKASADVPRGFDPEALRGATFNMPNYDRTLPAYRVVKYRMMGYDYDTIGEFFGVSSMPVRQTLAQYAPHLTGNGAGGNPDKAIRPDDPDAEAEMRIFRTEAVTQWAELKALPTVPKWYHDRKKDLIRMAVEGGMAVVEVAQTFDVSEKYVRLIIEGRI